jgi:hypothetical protein
VGAQTLSMSQLPRWKWKSEKPIAIGTHNSELARAVVAYRGVVSARLQA